eukprot:1297604-Rhodomonas_salina.2
MPASGLTTRRAAELATPLIKGIEWRELLSGNWSGKCTGFPNREGLGTCTVPDLERPKQRLNQGRL